MTNKQEDHKTDKFYSEISDTQGKNKNPGNFANRPKDEVKAAAAQGGHNSHRSDATPGKAIDDDHAEDAE